MAMYHKNIGYRSQSADLLDDVLFKRCAETFKRMILSRTLLRQYVYAGLRKCLNIYHSRTFMCILYVFLSTILKFLTSYVFYQVF